MAIGDRAAIVEMLKNGHAYGTLPIFRTPLQKSEIIVVKVHALCAMTIFISYSSTGMNL